MARRFISHLTRFERWRRIVPRLPKTTHVKKTTDTDQTAFVNSPWYKLVLMALLVSATLLIGGRRSSGDFPVYYLAAQRLRNGDDLYRIVPDEVYSYPPFAAFVCVPLTFMPQRAAQWVWGGLQAIALVLVIHLALLLSRRERAALTPRQQVCLVGAAVLIGARHLLSPLENAQTDLMIALLCFAAVYWIGMGWPIAAGVLLGAAIGLKATPLLFVPFLLRWRQWKAATAAVVAAVVLNLAPSMIFPSPLPKLHAVEWIESLAKPAVANGPAAARPGVWKEFTQLNQSLGGLLARLFINGAEDHGPLLWGLGHRGVQIVFLAIAALLMIVAATVRQGHWYGWPKAPLILTGYDASVVLCLMLLFSPKTSKAHLCSLILPILLLTARAVRAPKSAASIGWLVIGVGVGVLTKNLVGRQLANWLLDYGYLTWFILVILAYLWFWRTTDELEPVPVSR